MATNTENRDPQPRSPGTKPVDLRAVTGDIWLSWLIEGRDRGLDAQGLERRQQELTGLRDRLLRLARLQPGERALDLGAGTGLISLEARKAVSHGGMLTALDISHPSLASWRGLARDDADNPTVFQVAGDAQHIPVMSSTFDVVLSRSVLMYVDDRAAAVREIVRVLRSGGRVVMYEPVNAAGLEFDHWWGLDPSLLPATHALVFEHMMQHWPHRESVLKLDEPEMVGLFRAAGCVKIRASTLFSYQSDRHLSSEEALLFLQVPTYPGRPSYQESARAVLGNQATAHIERLVELLSSHPLTFAQARLMLQATTAPDRMEASG
jgi:ubiquinone/menaquinone biosynthesis C-methylase UbiE